MGDNRGIVRINQYDPETMIAPLGDDQIAGFELDGKVYLVFPSDYHNDVPRVNVDGRSIKVPLRAYKMVQCPTKRAIGTATCRLVNDSELLRRLAVKIDSDLQ